jgi:hypothetical protein
MGMGMGMVMRDGVLSLRDRLKIASKHAIHAKYRV